MPYLNVDDRMDEHPKIDGLTDAARWLHVCAMLYCARQLTDGFIPRGKARRLTDTSSDVVITELIGAGLWHDAGDGCLNGESVEGRTCHRHGRPGQYVIHDYLEWNHSKAWWEKRSTERADRAARGVHARWHVKRGVVDPDCKFCGHPTPPTEPTREPPTEPAPEPLPPPDSEPPF